MAYWCRCKKIGTLCKYTQTTVFFWVFKRNVDSHSEKNLWRTCDPHLFFKDATYGICKKAQPLLRPLLVCIWDLGTWSSYLLFLHLSGLASFSFSFGEALFSSLKVVFVPSIGVRRFIVSYWWHSGVVCIFVPLSRGWSEITATNAPVQDEAIQAVLGMNQKHILLPCPRIFEPPSLPQNFPLLPTSLPPTYLRPPTSLTSFPAHSISKA